MSSRARAYLAFAVAIFWQVATVVLIAVLSGILLLLPVFLLVIFFAALHVARER